MAAFVFTLLFSSALAAPMILSSRQTTSTCATGVHIITTRGTTEAQGDGAIGQLSTLIQNQIPGSDDYAVVYPATGLGNLTVYEASENAGSTAVVAAIEQYEASCPDTKIVLLGYSQGGQSTLDALCGTTEANFTSTPPLPSQYADKIAAVVSYGDPSFVVGQSYNVGNATMNGIFPRMDTAACAPYADRIASYCDANDPFCASGSDINVHLGYFAEYDNAAASFVVGKVNC